MAVRDVKTEWLRVRGYRAMTPQQRAEIAQGLIRTGRVSVENAIRAQHPRFTTRQIEMELWNRIYDRTWAVRGGALPRRERMAMEDWHIVAQIAQVLEANHASQIENLQFLMSNF